MSSTFAQQIDAALRKAGIKPPSSREALDDEGRWRASKEYRVKVRTCLMRANLIDDPDKPKRLEDAIPIRGICEDMCPEFERYTRINEHNVADPEKENGAPSQKRMVKAFSRSAAGQDEPLPMDIRSPTALRRTTDYLLDEVLGDEMGRPKVHSFLWDRTRAIRNDFSRQASSIGPSEWADYVYCLERIARFHIVALHQLSQDSVAPEGFVEHQEQEQLGRTLLSLIEAYTDCREQNIVCENEKEFRAYFALFNASAPDILEKVQSWGWEFWHESEEIQIAVSLIEMLQNTWDQRGPLNPTSASDIAQNAFCRYFSTVEDKKVSYTMACFAEIHFNAVRKSVFKTILASYRRQKTQTKEWTLSNLNAYLRFDDEQEVVAFGEAYGLSFAKSEGQTYLSFDNRTVTDPSPKHKQDFSGLVERKREGRSLRDIIRGTVYEEEGLFVQSGMPTIKPTVPPPPPFAAKPSFNPFAPKPAVNPFAPTTSTSKATPGWGSEASLAPTAPAPSATAFVFGAPSAPIPFASKTTSTVFGAPSVPATSTPNTAPWTFGAPSVPTTSAPTPAPPLFGTSAQTSSLPSPAPITLNVPSAAPSAPTYNPFAITSQIPASSGTSKSATSPPPAVSVVEVPRAFISTPAVPSEEPQPIAPPAPFKPDPPPQPPPQQQPVIAPLPVLKFLAKPEKLQSAPVAAAVSSPSPTSQFLTQRGTLKVAALAPAVTSPPSPSAVAFNPLDGFTEWYMKGIYGLVDQFIEAGVDHYVSEEFEKYSLEKAAQAAKEAEVALKITIANLRYNCLARKYMALWREGAHKKWMKRQGREARKSREDNARRAREAKAANNVVEDFRTSVTKSREKAMRSSRAARTLEEQLTASGVLNGVRRADSKIRAIASQSSRSRSFHHHRRSTTTTASSRDDPLRRSILSDPSYLSGESRILHMPSYKGEFESGTKKQISGVQGSYFRLKARGISMGTAARPSRQIEPSLPSVSSLQSEARSVSPDRSLPPAFPMNTLKRITPSMDTDDEDMLLLQESKRIRTMMEQDEAWFKEKTESVDWN